MSDGNDPVTHDGFHAWRARIRIDCVVWGFDRKTCSHMFHDQERLPDSESDPTVTRRGVKPFRFTIFSSKLHRAATPLEVLKNTFDEEK